MCDITTGFARRCKVGLGGINKFYLLPFVDYTSSEFVVNDNLITTFPNSVIYEFVFTGSLGFNNPQQENEGGNYYDESISPKFAKIGVDLELRELRKRDYRAIILDNNGNYRMLGAFNGLRCDSIKAETGTNKDSFNGWTLEFTGQEERESLYLTDLTGFTIQGVDYNFIFEDGNNFIFEDNNNFIFN